MGLHPMDQTSHPGQKVPGLIRRVQLRFYLTILSGFALVENPVEQARGHPQEQYPTPVGVAHVAIPGQQMCIYSIIGREFVAFLPECMM